MKRIFSLLLILTLLFTACGAKEEVPAACAHADVYAATCAEPETCADCGETLGKPSAHDFVQESCEGDMVCSVCGVTQPGEGSHTPAAEPTCSEAQVCADCGEILAEALPHEADGEGSCTQDVCCIHCGTVMVAAAHEPAGEATCIDAQRCLRCGEEVAPALGHTAGEVTAELAPTLCSRCGVTMVKGDAANPEEYVHETVSGVHYNNNIDAYYSGNVLVCGDYALEYFSMDRAGYPAWAEAVSGFAAAYPDVNVSALLIPKSCAYNSPAGYENTEGSQTAFIDSTYAMLDDTVTAVDAAGEMGAHRGEYLYYRTDHHWTSLGAYYASAAYCKANGILPRALGSYETCVRTGYVGSLYGFCEVPPDCLKTNPDYTAFHMPLTRYTMTYDNGSGPIMGEMLDVETNSYAGAFICGDNALTHIETDAGTGRKLLIFKESYGNAFVPFMADYYDDIFVIDIRHNTFSVSSLIAEHGITDALIINNVQGATSLTDSLAARLAS